MKQCCDHCNRCWEALHDRVITATGVERHCMMEWSLQQVSRGTAWWSDHSTATWETGNAWCSGKRIWHTDGLTASTRSVLTKISRLLVTVVTMMPWHHWSLWCHDIIGHYDAMTSLVTMMPWHHWSLWCHDIIGHYDAMTSLVTMMPWHYRSLWCHDIIGHYDAMTSLVTMMPWHHWSLWCHDIIGYYDI